MIRLMTVALLGVALLTGCGAATGNSIPTTNATGGDTTLLTDNGTSPPTTTKPKDNLTAGQKNAIQTAKDYLTSSSFSQSGLTSQLKYEGYNKTESTFAVNSLHVDWNKEAVGTAKDYLASSSFSRSGLISQLEYEGYTTAQATYGVNKAYG